MGNASERDGEQGLRVHREIEDAYADIGRSVVELASRQAAQRAGSGSGSSQGSTATVDVTVNLRLSLEDQGGPERMRPRVCCICTIEGDVIICRGPCCDW